MRSSFKKEFITNDKDINTVGYFREEQTVDVGGNNITIHGYVYSNKGDFMLCVRSNVNLSKQLSKELWVSYKSTPESFLTALHNTATVLALLGDSTLIDSILDDNAFNYGSALNQCSKVDAIAKLDEILTYLVNSANNSNFSKYKVENEEVQVLKNKLMKAGQERDMFELQFKDMETKYNNLVELYEDLYERHTKLVNQSAKNKIIVEEISKIFSTGTNE